VASLAEDLEHVIGTDEPLFGINWLVRAAAGLDDYTVAVFVHALPPVGRLTEELIVIDRAFRLAARFVESQQSLDQFLSRPRRGIPVGNGLIAESFDPGSLRIRLRPSQQMRAHLKTFGLAELALAVAILNGTVDFAKKFEDEPASEGPHRIHYYAPQPQIEVEVHIHIERGSEEEDIVLDGAGAKGYRVLPPGSAQKHLDPPSGP
jgi:hypothetical protein